MIVGRAGRPRPGAGGKPGSARLLAGTGGSDRGSATVWVLAAGLVLLAAGLAGASVGAAHVARHQAQAAADLAALAGAARVVEGPAASCGRAAELARANRARLVGCEQAGLEITVRVEVTPAGLVGSRAATATARAGPVHG